MPSRPTGWLLLAEQVTPRALVGVAVVLVGVALIVRERRSGAAKTGSF